MWVAVRSRGGATGRGRGVREQAAMSGSDASGSGQQGGSEQRGNSIVVKHRIGGCQVERRSGVYNGRASQGRGQRRAAFWCTRRREGPPPHCPPDCCCCCCCPPSGPSMGSPCSWNSCSSRSLALRQKRFGAGGAAVSCCGGRTEQPRGAGTGASDARCKQPGTQSAVAQSTVAQSAVAQPAPGAAVWAASPVDLGLQVEGAALLVGLHQVLVLLRQAEGEQRGTA